MSSLFKYLIVILLSFLAGFLVKYFIVEKSFFKKQTTVLFKNKVYQPGNIKIGEEKNIYFKFKNTGKNPLILYDVQARCGCTNVDWEKDTLQPNETDSICVIFNSKALGFFTKEILFYSNSVENPTHLFLQGTVVKN